MALSTGEWKPANTSRNRRAGAGKRARASLAFFASVMACLMKALLVLLWLVLFRRQVRARLDVHSFLRRLFCRLWLNGEDGVWLRGRVRAQAFLWLRRYVIQGRKL